MAYRHPLFTVSTPIPDRLRQVTLYEDTWEGHILVYHPEMGDHDAAVVERTIVNPTKISLSNTSPGNYIFVNERITDEGGRSLRVPVAPIGIDGRVSSAYFSSNTSDIGDVIWERGTSTPTKGQK